MPKPRNTQLRIISGAYKGRRLSVRASDALRPTTDQAREMLFNWLMNEIQGRRCLDLFAGSGALGFEAMSRGAESVTFVEKQSRVCQQIWQTIDQLGCPRADVILAELPKQINTLTGPFDLVFIDPPFSQDLVVPCLTALASSNLLADSALIYVECEAQQQIEPPLSWRALKMKVRGASAHALYAVGKNR